MASEEFQEFMRRFFEGIPQAPTDNDPSHYAKSIPITHEECLMLLTRISMEQERYKALQEQAQKLWEQMQVIGAEYTALKTKLFYILREQYPEITKDTMGHGWRKFNDEYFFVGWDDVKKPS